MRVAENWQIFRAKEWLYEVLLEKYVGSEKQLCSFLLENLVHTFLYVMDDTYLTTHSFPSGHFLTAIVNSLVNRVIQLSGIKG